MNEERRILVASDSGISIRSFGDISDAIGACIGAEALILTENDLAPEFFDLRSGLAGELFQKCMNYRVRLAVVLPAPEAYGERFRELAYTKELKPSGWLNAATESTTVASSAASFPPSPPKKQLRSHIVRGSDLRQR